MDVWLGIKQVGCHERYLGLPTFAERCKRIFFFGFIKDTVWKKVKGWKRYAFSIVGKEILLKAMVQAIPSYDTSCFILSKIIKDLHRLIADFW